MSNFIMVPVPEDRVPEVYALLASVPVTPGRTPAEPQTPSEWNDEEIRKAYRESTGHIRRVIDYLAARPGQWIPSSELYGDLELTSHQFSGVMGSFGKRIKNRHDGKAWFFDYRWDNEAGMVFYIMSEVVAAIIRTET